MGPTKFGRNTLLRTIFGRTGFASDSNVELIPAGCKARIRLLGVRQLCNLSFAF